MTESKPFRSGYVAICGRPNVGKSTLLNRLVGEKVAIVTEKPQTTRNRILGVCEREGGQIIFLDTPGIMSPRHKLDESLIGAVERAVRDADIVVFLVDLSVRPRENDRLAASVLKRAETPVVMVMNKVDTVPKDRLKERVTEYRKLGEFAGGMVISALRDINAMEVADRLVSMLPEGPAYYPEGTATDVPDKFAIGELIREKVLLSLRQEVPHSVAVTTEEITRRSDELTYVAGTIYVEKKSQKMIAIGRKGSMLREIGAAARVEIEELLGTKVYLELRVKIAKNWRKDEAVLRRLGYTRGKRKKQ